MWQEILHNIPIALVAAIYLLDIAETMSLIPELKGKELESASTSPTGWSVSVFGHHRREDSRREFRQSSNPDLDVASRSRFGLSNPGQHVQCRMA
jgi:hypothetical protein